MKTTTKSKLQALKGASIVTDNDGTNRDSDNGKNDLSKHFQFVSSMLLGNYQTFSLQDAYQLARLCPALEEDHVAVKNLYETWTRKALLDGEIVCLPTCYELPLFGVA